MVVLKKKGIIVALVVVAFLYGLVVKDRTRLHCYMKFDGILAPPEVNLAAGLDPLENETFPGVTTFVNDIFGDFVCLNYYNGRKYCDIVAEIKKNSPVAGWFLNEC